MAEYTVGGFTFSDEETAKKAAKELKAVDYILEQLKNADEQTALKLYNQILEKKMFQTEVGLSFLNQLRNNLLNLGIFSSEDIKPVYKIDKKQSAEKKKVTQDNQRQNSISVKSKNETKIKSSFSYEAEIKRLKKINTFLLTLCITLTLCVIGMFYVSTTINSPNILNYEEKLIDKYSSWEQDLTEREEQLKQEKNNNN